MGVPEAFKAQFYIHVIVLMRGEVYKKKLNIIRSAVETTLASIAVQLVQKASDASTKSFLLGSLRVVVEPYIYFNPAVVQFQVVSQWTDGFVSLKQQETLFETGSPLLLPNGAEATIRDWSPEADDIIWLLCYAMLENVSDLISNNWL